MNVVEVLSKGRRNKYHDILNLDIGTFADMIRVLGNDCNEVDTNKVKLGNLVELSGRKHSIQWGVYFNDSASGKNPGIFIADVSADPKMIGIVFDDHAGDNILWVVTYRIFGNSLCSVGEDRYFYDVKNMQRIISDYLDRMKIHLMKSLSEHLIESISKGSRMRNTDTELTQRMTLQEAISTLDSLYIEEVNSKDNFHERVLEDLLMKARNNQRNLYICWRDDLTLCVTDWRDLCVYTIDWEIGKESDGIIRVSKSILKKDLYLKLDRISTGSRVNVALSEINQILKK